MYIEVKIVWFFCNSFMQIQFFIKHIHHFISLYIILKIIGLVV